MTHQIRTDIPRTIARAVRQKCKFCCVVCGHWIYELDHIKEWAEVHEHTEDNLICLCPNHHSKKTKNLISAAQAKRYLEKRASESLPFTASDTQLIEPDTVALGTNVIDGFHANSGDVFRFGNSSYLSVKKYPGEAYRIDCRIIDNIGKPSLVIEENEMVIGTHMWDIEQKGCKLTFRYGPGDIFMEIELNASKNYINLQGNFDIGLTNHIAINGRGIYLGKIVLLKFNHIHSCRDGLIINQHPENHRCLANNHGNYTSVVSSCTAMRCDVGIMNTINGFNNKFSECRTAIMYDIPTLNRLSKEHDHIVKVQAGMLPSELVR
ncbi:MAG: HNH endonuclease [Candidatus Thiodiazotropha sp. (ex Myrtea spinifera)]|nr:HNH endonuclease [Candidatus Thiodiazotropha sp. (ex Myrtea spinifera)]MCU7829763.1 HNH endonuclease [Candidatus Thiodiazotropha sp. (ex Myrtea sp. 'scaly one' KF741663)]